MADEAPLTLRNRAAHPERGYQPEPSIDAALGGAFNTSGRSNLPPQTRLRFLNVDEAAADEAAAAPPPVAAAPGMFFASRDDDATRRGDGNEATADQLEGLSIEELRDIASARVLHRGELLRFITNPQIEPRPALRRHDRLLTNNPVTSENRTAWTEQAR